MPKPSIALIIPSLRVGGTQKVFTLISEHLSSDLFTTSLIVLDGSKGSDRFDSTCLQFYDLKTPRVRNSVFKIIRLCRRIKPDIILTGQGHLNLYLILFRRLFPDKTMFVARESNIPSKKLQSGQNSWILNILYKKFYNKYDLIISQSQDMKEDLMHSYEISDSKIKVIHNPVIRPKINFQKKQFDSFDILAVGSTLSQQKGFDRLLEAFSLVKKKDAKLVILGEGRARQSLEDSIKRMGLEGRVILPGLVKDVDNYFRGAKVFALSSYFEGFPNVCLEAGIHGLPVVSFDVLGGIRELIIPNKTGIIVKDGDISSFARALDEILLNPFKYNQEKISDLTFSRFGIQNIIKQYEETFSELLSNKQ